MKNLKKYIVSWLMLVALLVTTGCSDLLYSTYETGEIAIIGGSDGPTSIIVAKEAETGEAEVVRSESASAEVAGEEPSSEEKLLDPDGSYTTCEDVALYLETYGELPDNFITKNEAKALGWEGGSLEPYAPGKCIGGDKFGNYEGLLPKESGRTYRECDIDTLGTGSRGAKRIVYSNDGLIYYTEDHYESFTLLYD